MNIAMFPSLAGLGQPQIEAGLAFSKPSLSVSVRSDLHECTPMNPHGLTIDATMVQSRHWC